MYRSGELYLVTDGTTGRLVPSDGRRPYPPDDLQAILAHCNASEPWEEVPEGDPLPAAVAKVVARDEGRDFP